MGSFLGNIFLDPLLSGSRPSFKVMEKIARLREVNIYTDLPSSALDISGVIDFLDSLEIRVELRGDFFEYIALEEARQREASRLLAAFRVEDIESPLDRLADPDPLDIESELRCLRRIESYGSRLYDGGWLQRAFCSLLSEKTGVVGDSGAVHIVITGRLFGTFEVKRYHARVMLSGAPALVSTAGIVEGPARPREYYFMKASFLQSGRDPKDLDQLDQLFDGQYLVHDGPLIDKVIPSYVLQGIFYTATGREFCADPECCLFNSHWQTEVLKAQLDGKLCGECTEALKILA